MVFICRVVDFCCLILQVIGLNELEGLLGPRPFAATGELRNIDR